ncbi:MULTISPECIES: hypothetical protein [Bifidobacterium]|uniref:hypothetical protein n=1 Tax=Bifidobacterium TaxID=1678 RepID=UPI001BDCC4AF|nr:MULTISPECIES: hypothetical protein [Bifidobacterium]MBT1170137.1 hypothetical protein [Bifidobacterium sp. SO4]MBW3090184.1 hypothetical protein [Bifidobacterium miconisargentati]
MMFIKDNTHPFDYAERLSGCPSGFEARIVRFTKELPFNATVIMPPNKVPADVDFELVGNHAVLHHMTPDLGAAEDWTMAWACR